MDNLAVGIIVAIFASTGLWSFVTFLVTRYFTQKDGKAIEQKALKDAILAVLHDRVYQICSEHLATGHLTKEELRNLEYLFNSYEELGGNGTGAELYARCKQLHIK